MYEGAWEKNEKNGKGREFLAGVGGGGGGGGEEEPEKVAAVVGNNWYEGQWRNGNHHGQGNRSWLRMGHLKARYSMARAIQTSF